MMNIRQRKFLFALLALLLIFAGCKGESPTAPPPTSGNPGSGGTTPPTGASVTLTVSNATPVVDSTTVITATVTQNGANVPNGTAVEFSTNIGTFSDSGTNTTLRTTTNGVATVTLTSSTPGTATITAVVNNVSKQTSVTFQAKPVTPVPPDLTPTITGISPAIGRPQGGETLTISGKNFQAPVRVLFDTGNGTPKEAFVLSVTPTQIQVLTPPVDLATGQQKAATVVVINQAGTTSEARIQASTPFTYQLETLTPRITTTSPNSGPINGGTRVTIFGDGFQAPVQVFFGSAEAQVVNVSFSQIIVLSPPAPATNEPGSGTVTGFVPITVININSATRVTADNGFRYTPKILITAISPLSGPSLGGTDIRIDGSGFDDPVQVTIGALPSVVQLQVLRVSGTEILARTLPLSSPCTAVSGPINVTNVEDGATATSGLNFSFIAVNPSIVSVAPASGVQPGGTAVVTVLNPGIGALGTGLIRFTVNDQNVVPSPSTVTTGTGTQVFNVPIPTTGFTFPTVACTTTVGGLAGTQLGPIDVALGFQNSTTGCNDTVSGAVHILPPGANACVTPPSPSVTSPAGGGCATPPPANVSSGPPLTTQTTITISNANEAAPLDITNVTIGGTNASEFSIAPTQALQIPAGSSRTFTLTFDPTTAGAKAATVTFATNSPSAPALNVCVTATANP